MLQELVRSLSPESRHMRFASSFKEMPAAMLSRFTLIDYDREMALVAVHKSPEASHERIVGVSRYVTNPDKASCEFSLVVADDFKGKGLGSRLMESIMDVARERGLTRMDGLVLNHNADMLKLVKGLGFQAKRSAEDPDFNLVSHSL